ncbi:MAG: tRNA (cytidine(34)-2'-O)-methyltransferase [Planctomycetaceae bacterium]|nr:tRNA (cytidine(34)-2'-O)-methyltransferase [Planctomycetaceae bacterium]MBQ2822538.1 tRNA (cytidine(34)-2'-O)-methyltransferase [Thermoguttaceae bacterium]
MCMNFNVLNIVLFQPEIPHNTGAVGRSCVGTGAKLWLVRPMGFQITDRNLKRAGLDYWQHLDWEIADSWEELRQKLPQWDRYFFFTKKAKHSYLDICYRKGDVLVFGSESQGFPDWFHESYQEQCVKIPIRPQIRSLNLSVSVGISSFEAMRQIGMSEMSE